MLSVKNYAKAHAPTTEKGFEKTFVSFLEKLDIYSRHMSDAVPGLPDRYIEGGRWVELKSISFTRDVAFGAGLDIAQRNQMTDLSEAGDRVWYMALLQHTSGAKFVWLVPWKKRKQYEGRRFTLTDMRNNYGDIFYQYPGELWSVIQEIR